MEVFEKLGGKRGEKRFVFVKHEDCGGRRTTIIAEVSPRWELPGNMSIIPLTMVIKISRSPSVGL